MYNLLKKHFGYDEFRPLQRQIINNVLSGKDALVLMPTGGGKSLCFQLPAIMLEGVTIVISPLISLMKDQVDTLKANGINAEFINSSLQGQEIANIMRETKKKNIKMLYVAPERFNLASFRNFLQSLCVTLIAIDEGHCISEWGHDFRPDYRSLSTLRDDFPGVPIIALTATATEKVRDDIVIQLNLNNPEIFQSGFDRKNLNYSVVKKQKAFNELIFHLKRHKNEPTIIYRFSRKNTESLAADLQNEGFVAKFYHAGMDNELRQSVQEEFIRDEISIIVATIAFGMGIDKPDVRLIVHYDLPKSVEGYYQETGRAGRDGLPSECILFYSYGDKIKHDFFIDQIEDPVEKKKAQKKIMRIIDFCELQSCRRKYLIEYFGESWEKENCGGCDVCLSPKEEFDATIISQKILSCIIRTGGRFGANHIIDVLLGKDIKKVRDRGHNQLSVFGIVKDFNGEELRELINALTAKKLLKKDVESFPTFDLTQSGWKFIRQREKIKLLKPTVAKGKEERLAKQVETEYDSRLFEELRVLRKRLANEKRVPPFIIFGDRSLRQMATYLPKDIRSFSRISGVGAQKLDSFGELFISVINNYSEKQSIKGDVTVADHK